MAAQYQWACLALLRTELATASTPLPVHLFDPVMTEEDRAFAESQGMAMLTDNKVRVSVLILVWRLSS